MTNEWLKHLARLYLPVHQYETSTTKIIYAGYSSVKKNYYMRLLLDGSGHHTFLGRRLFWDIPGLIKSYELDMAVSEISFIALKHFQKYDGFILPEWATTRINIDRPLCEICHRNVSDFSNVTRRIRKYNLTPEILRDKESFNFFNEKIFLPYITKRYGEEALIDDLNKIWELSPPPILLAIREQGVIVGAALMRKSEGSLNFMRLGLLDGNDEYRLHGVIGALYYFGIVEGQKMGCRYFDLGGTRPFLKDGLTKFKMGLGAEFVKDLSSRKEYLWLGVNEHTSVTKEFLNNNPFMHLNKDFRLEQHGS
jgi:hypothetical protein